MSVRAPRATSPGPESPSLLPAFGELLERLDSRLVDERRAALLSVTVLQRAEATDAAQSSSGYEETIRHVAAFLSEYRARRMRRDDRVFEPAVNGNAFVVLLQPPRSGRTVDISVVARVRMRLRRGLRAHLARALSRETAESFGCWVGGAFLHPGDGVPLERRVHRALEEAFADALRDREREGRRHAVQLHRVLDQGLVRSVYQPLVDPASKAKPKPMFSEAVAFDVSMTMRELAATPRFPFDAVADGVDIRRERDLMVGGDAPFTGDGALQSTSGAAAFVALAAPATFANFEGLSNLDNFNLFGFRVNPPDPVGDVGPNHYVEMINLAVAVYDKQGNLLLGPIPIGELWAGYPIDDCTDPSGDPVVLYDQLEDRWILSQFTTRGPLGCSTLL